MKAGFFIRTAAGNLKKNYRFYIPSILTGTGLLACLYIVYTIKSDERIKNIPGGDYLPIIMSIGVAVVSLLSVILIFYTNSFLMKQRKHEYGLYNVLGMEKRHIGRILFWETALGAIASIVLGSALGILFYKLCSLLICNILHSDIILGFDFITPSTIIPPAMFFALIYLGAFLINRISIARMKPVEMLKSKETGEREPRVKWLILVLGIIFLIGGYIISVATTNPLSALLLFFVAVFAVIIGTYFLFTAGSIFVLKKLKASKKYYYNKKHMPSVSGLLYRMKQNAVGLASICILATGVLVMLSSTVSLYGGMEDTLREHYPQDLYFSCEWQSNDGVSHQVEYDELTEIAKNAFKKFDLKIKQIENQEYIDNYSVNAAGGTSNQKVIKRIAVTFDDRDKAAEVGDELWNEMDMALNQQLLKEAEFKGQMGMILETYWDAKEGVVGLYGSLLFLGIILGVVCMFATVLIIYYKQISEGYEDRGRYQIMKKVGMSDAEIKKTIHSQTLLVFFLPLAFATINMAFAFPMINRLLHLLLLSKTVLFVICSLATVAVFAIVYVIIYLLTARTYYKIVR